MVQHLRNGVFFTVVSAAIVLLFTGIVARAQTGNGAVTGVVSDTSGSVIPNAKVTLVNIASGEALTQTTGTDGRYTFPTVAPGMYAITIQPVRPRELYRSHHQPDSGHLWRGH